MSFFSSSPLRASLPILPLYNSPKSPNSSPAPTRSVLRSPPRSRIRDGESAQDVLLALARQTAHLQQTLQADLDAQSAGLLAGLGRAPTEGAADSQPTASSSYVQTSPRSQHSAQVSSQSSRSTQSPRSRKATPTLKQARSSIHNTLLTIASTKSAEAQTYASAQDPLDTFLSNLSSLLSKQDGLDAHISELENSREAADLVALAEEEAALETQVRELEEQLAERKAKLRQVKQRREAESSTRDAELSSWKHARVEVTKRIESEVLADGVMPDLSGLLGTGAADSGSGSAASPRTGSTALNTTGSPSAAEDGSTLPVWSLHPSRRTASLVREAIEAARAVTEARKAAAQREADACTQGADVWEGAIAAVTRVERALRREMSRLEAPADETSISASAATPAARNGRDSQVSTPTPLDPIMAPFNEEDPLSSSPRLPPLPPTGPHGPQSPLASSPTLPTDVTASFATARSSNNQTDKQHAPSAMSGVGGEGTTASGEALAAAYGGPLPKGKEDQNAQGMLTVLNLMDRAIATLESDAALAQTQNWTPLVCAIGAEAAAMAEARDVLASALGVKRRSRGSSRRSSRRNRSRGVSGEPNPKSLSSEGVSREPHSRRTSLRRDNANRLGSRGSVGPSTDNEVDGGTSGNGAEVFMDERGSGLGFTEHTARPRNGETLELREMLTNTDKGKERALLDLEDDDGPSADLLVERGEE